MLNGHSNFYLNQKHNKTFELINKCFPFSRKQNILNRYSIFKVCFRSKTENTHYILMISKILILLHIFFFMLLSKIKSCAPVLVFLIKLDKVKEVATGND